MERHRWEIFQAGGCSCRSVSVLLHPREFHLDFPGETSYLRIAFCGFSPCWKCSCTRRLERKCCFFFQLSATDGNPCLFRNLRLSSHLSSLNKRCKVTENTNSMQESGYLTESLLRFAAVCFDNGAVA